MDIDFTVVGIIDQKDTKKIEDPPYWKTVLKNFARNKGALISAIIIFLIAFLAVVGPYLTPYRYDALDTSIKNLPPRTSNHFFGTDSMGRDLFARVCIGTRISLFVAMVAVLIDAFIGITIGLISGYAGGKTDMILQRIIEIMSSIPELVIVTLLLLVIKPGLFTIILALLMTSWIGMSKVVRAQVLQLKTQEYILASRTLGTSLMHVLFREILPNTMGQVIIMTMMSIPSAIFTESFLSFIGLGIPEPMASLGSLISSGFKNMMLYPYQIAIPVVFFSLLMISFNLAADGLRDALDPKMYD